MTLKNAAGTTVTKAAVTTYTDPDDSTLTWSEDIYEDYEFPGVGAGYEKAHKLKYAAGTKITQTGYDALFPTATATAISPATGLAAGGLAVTITGTGFRGASGVTFGGTAATAFVVRSDTSITCTTPPHAAGAVNVVIAATGGALTKTSFFTYT